MPTMADNGYHSATAEEFLSLVMADDELVRAEFDAIVAAEWPSPPADCAEPGQDKDRSAHPAQLPAGPVPPPPSEQLRNARIDRWRRQRSPPASSLVVRRTRRG